jgi:predicted phosphodiesterase
MIGVHKPHLHTEIKARLEDGERVADIMRALQVSRNSVTLIRDGVVSQPTFRGTEKPRFRVKAGSSNAPEKFIQSGAVCRVVVIADTHDNPTLPQDRFRQLGKFIQDFSPDVVVHLGDWADFEFASRFESWESIHGRERSPFRDEIDSLRRAIDLLHEPFAHMSKPPKLVTTAGNHDHRIWEWENNHPECEGMMWVEFEKALGSWDVYPYREYFFLDGIGFTHVPQTKLNKPIGGENVGRTIANKSTFSVVFGHTHEPLYLPTAKFGPDNSVTAFNPGTALPAGFVKQYARGSVTGWGWSIGTLDICDGRIIGHQIVPMSELARRYG